MMLCPQCGGPVHPQDLRCPCGYEFSAEGAQPPRPAPAAQPAPASLKSFAIYRHEKSGQVIAIKNGFSWPAFLFLFWWAAVKGHWTLAFNLLILTIVANSLPCAMLCGGGSPCRLASSGLC